MAFASRRVPETATYWGNRPAGAGIHSVHFQEASTDNDPVATRQTAEPPSILPDPRLSYTRQIADGSSRPISTTHHWRPETNPPESPTKSSSTSKSNLESSSQSSSQQREDSLSQLEEIKAETAYLKQQRISSHQTMSTLKVQLKQAQDQGVADGKEISRLRSLLQDARDEEERLNVEIDQRIERETGLLDQIDASQTARLRSLQLAEEGMSVQGKGEVEFVMARSVRPGMQKRKRSKGKRK